MKKPKRGMPERVACGGGCRAASYPQLRGIGVSKPKDVLTTGQVARICKVAPRTVSKWFDTGQLRGYRIPGSKDRRIPLQHLIRFMRAHGIPLNGLETGQLRVLLIDRDLELADLVRKSLSEGGEYEVRTAGSLLEAGAAAEALRPAVVVIDVDMPGLDYAEFCRFFSSRAELQSTRLIAVGAAMTESDRQLLIQQGFAGTLAKPFSIRQLTETIDTVTGIEQ